MNDVSEENAGAVPPWAAGTAERMHELDPELNQDELELVKSYGVVKQFPGNQLLWAAGERSSMMVVLEGSIDVFRISGEREIVIISHAHGHYVGETITMAGGRALVSGRAGPDGLTAVIVESAELQQLIATESELGEKILLSFILRRMRMIAENLGNIMLIGDQEDIRTVSLRSFLSRNGVPFETVSPQDKRIQADKLLDGHGIKLNGDPVLVNNGQALVNPSNRDVAESLGFTADVHAIDCYDVAIVGSGPAGLAAAVYAASEGLSVLVLERCAPGGQAGSSSRIENYMGFPTGISGQGLMGRGYIQAQKFGAKVAIARELKTFECGDVSHKLHLDGGDTINARTVIFASGAVYRQPIIENLDGLAGVHYGASHIEAQMCQQKSVLVIGGGNSAGQAAVFLSKHAKQVKILIRGKSLASSMSDYLIQRIDKLPNVELLTNSEVIRAHGDQQLQSVTVLNNVTKQEVDVEAAHLFIFIGAKAGSEFIEDDIALDDKGFILTGDAITEDTLSTMGWNLDRKPFLLETSCPRVFAVGDVRAGSIKRVASAVGEGSVCIQFVHKVLADQL